MAHPLLMHGDCLQKMAVIPSGAVDIILTDPPYGNMKGANLGGGGMTSRRTGTTVSPSGP